ncbi:hypothetical protein GKIL_1182 [Gloeobacter kilaueensis JS1]|uniref:Uncharacterized protein n=1 Tax=Gloeobacter kilaueensis (strain ATCC BAA-2537 / CCAP 1431/1 / ULC 316 / JS1) TaxID=1183438 RepID=U5QEZ6_GLOK1|nr:hypothetical protein GKIL_1182 [Gloeobacter kilaueensis JS1]
MTTPDHPLQAQDSIRVRRARLLNFGEHVHDARAILPVNKLSHSVTDDTFLSRYGLHRFGTWVQGRPYIG